MPPSLNPHEAPVDHQLSAGEGSGDKPAKPSDEVGSRAVEAARVMLTGGAVPPMEMRVDATGELVHPDKWHEE